MAAKATATFPQDQWEIVKKFIKGQGGDKWAAMMAAVALLTWAVKEFTGGAASWGTTEVATVKAQIAGLTNSQIADLVDARIGMGDSPTGPSAAFTFPAWLIPILLDLIRRFLEGQNS